VKYERRCLAGWSHQRGLTLVEMLVAMTLGLVVLVGLSSVYVAVKQSFRFQETSGRMVEDGNFALDSIARDLRMAGFAGCMGITSVTVGSVTTYYPTSSLNSATPNPGGIDGPNPLAVVEPSNTAVTTQPLMPKGFLRGFDSIPSAMFASGAAPAAGSNSALYFASGSANVVSLSAAMATPTDALTIAEDTYKWRSTTTNSGVYDFVVSDCATSNLFRGKVSLSGGVTTVAHDSALGNQSGSFAGSPLYGVGSMVMPLEWKFFYIATPSGAATPSLYMVGYDGNNRQSAQEIVSNVEAMRIHYGENTANNPDGSATMQPDIWRSTAAAVTDWSRVVAVRVGLIMVSAQDNADNEIPLAVPTLLGQAYTLPTGASGNRVRKEFSTTVVLRNRVAAR
jgi:type IV pilus assembly protein PilW